MSKLFAKYKVFPAVPGPGNYLARINDIREYRNSLTVEFAPFVETKGKVIWYAPVYLKITENNTGYSAAANFIEIFRDFENYDDIIGYVIGITIKDNVKDDFVYHNVVDVFIPEDDEENGAEEVSDTVDSEDEDENQDAENNQDDDEEETFLDDEEDEF